MTNKPIDLPLDNETPLVEPPLVDLLYLDEARQAFVVTFVPDDNVSPKEKELVEVPVQSEDGRRIQLRLGQLARILGQAVIKLYHGGGGNFGFYLKDGSLRELHDRRGSNALSQDVYVHLQDLGMIAEIAFRERQLLQQAANSRV